MIFDPTKPVQTRAGEKVRILATDLPGEWPIVAAIIDDCDGYEITSYTASGKVFPDGENSPVDLVNIPEDQFAWVNLYKQPSGRLYFGSEYSCRGEAVEFSHPSAVGRIKIKLVEGQWDE